ncbi:hypothetical protein Dimus_020209 [Dionaea muscipula]
MDLQPPPPPQLRSRRTTPCHRHPGQNPSYGLCAPCLSERLSLLNPSACPDPSQPSNALVDNAASSSSSSIKSELRRCNTFSGNKCERVGGLACEPRRNSCDVRVRSSLLELFNLEDDGCSGLSHNCEIESTNLGLLRGTCPVLELNEDEGESHNADDGEDDNENIRAVVDSEIRHFEDAIVPDAEHIEEITEECEDTKSMKELIDLEFMSSKPVRRDFKEIASNFWVAASVFSRKLRNLRGEQRSRKSSGQPGGDGGVAAHENLREMQIDKLRGRWLRDAQSEVGDYGFGRRSCDTDPRCSVDFGRASIDDGGRVWLDLLGRRSCDTDSKFSIDLGRASVDGGGARMSVSEAARCSTSFQPPSVSWDEQVARRTVARGATPTVSVIENAMATVYGFDNQTLAEEKLMVNGDDTHFDGIGKFDSVCLQRQRQSKGFDHSKMALDDEIRQTSNGKDSPANVEIFHGTRLLISEKEMKGSLGFSCLEDDSLGSSESASKDTALSSSSNSGKQSKKGRRWTKLCSILGFLQPRNHNKQGDEEKSIRGGADDPLADSSWKTPKLVCSYSSNTTPSTVHRTSDRTPTNGRSRKRREEAVLKRYCSARYSPNNQSARYSPSSSLDNGLLRFNLTPLKTYRRRSIKEKVVDCCANVPFSMSYKRSSLRNYESFLSFDFRR